MKDLESKVDGVQTAALQKQVEALLEEIVRLKAYIAELERAVGQGGGASGVDMGELQRTATAAAVSSVGKAATSSQHERTQPRAAYGLRSAVGGRPAGGFCIPARWPAPSRSQDLVL